MKFNILRLMGAQATLVAWAKTLPKLLWELKAACLPTTTSILSILNMLGACRVMASPRTPLVDQLQSTLLFFFYMQKPNLYGPFAMMPQELQIRAVQLFFYVENVDTPVYQALARCTHLQELAAPVVATIIRSLLLRLTKSTGMEEDSNSAQHSKNTGHFLSFLFAAGLGYSKTMLDYARSASRSGSGSGSGCGALAAASGSGPENEAETDAAASAPHVT